MKLTVQQLVDYLFYDRKLYRQIVTDSARSYLVGGYFLVYSPFDSRLNTLTSNDVKLSTFQAFSKVKFTP